MGAVAEAARVFSGAKTVDSPTLNAVGVQPARMVVARALYRARRAPHDDALGEHLAVLRREGIVVIPDFLPPERFAAMRAEAMTVLEDDSRMKLHVHGGTRVEHYTMSGLDDASFPNLAWWLQGPAVDLAEGAERRKIGADEGLRVIERVVHGGASEPDPETDLHVDTFFNTHKLWLYLNDVSPENGPLAYVPRSHRLSLERLRQEYAGSRRSTTRSRRVQQEEVVRRGLDAMRATCVANSLVMVNTCGYHSRSKGAPHATREALHMSFRYNPFFPPALHVDERVNSRGRRLEGAAGSS
jgi:hypothetical protein